MSSAPDSYNREDLFETLHSNISGLKDTEEYSEEVVEKARDIEEVILEVEQSFDELEEFSDTAQEYIRYLEGLTSDLGERIDELEESDGDETDYSEIEDLLDNHLAWMDELLGEYMEDIPEPETGITFTNHKSPTFNFGVEPSEPSYGNFKSPTFNFAGMPSWGSGGSRGTGRGFTNVLESWDDYNWEGWEDTGEPEFDTPADYAESRGVDTSTEPSTESSWPSIKITYHQEEEDIGAWFGDSEEYFPDSSEPDMPWGGAAS